MCAVAYGLLRRRLLAILSVCLILPIILAGGVGKAAPTSQTPTSTPAPGKPILLTDPVPDPQQDGVTYFSETGHTLRGKFLDYWQTHGGLAQFGYPLTEEFFEPDGPNGALVQVQYFERNRFELHPENQPPSDVLLGRLGIEFHPQDPSADRDAAPASYFPQTGHNLSGVFMDYWQTHGGLAVNGYPISEPMMETSTDGKEYLTQWFERAKFEEHPENAGTPYEVLLGQLGRQLSEKRGYPYGWYPTYGHAPDYSWLSGQIEWREANNGLATATCNILRYDQSKEPTRLHNEAQVQLDGPGWPPFIELLGPAPPPHLGDFIVIFGHNADKNEHYQYCRVDPAPGYIVYKWQANPAQ